MVDSLASRKIVYTQDITHLIQKLFGETAVGVRPPRTLCLSFLQQGEGGERGV